MTLNPKASSCGHGPAGGPKFAWKDAAHRCGYRLAVKDPPLQKKRDGLVSNSFFSGLGVKRFSDLLIEGVAFAFGREPSVFGLDIGFAFL